MDAQLNLFGSHPSAAKPKQSKASSAHRASDAHLTQATEPAEDKSWISNTLQRVEGRVEKNSRFFVTQDGEEIRLLLMDRPKVQPEMQIRAIAFTNPTGGRYALPGTLRQIFNDPSQPCR